MHTYTPPPHTGSFKMRGVGTACSHAVHQHNATTLVAASGGNAGMAVAVAGEQLGVSTRVFVPSTTSQLAQGNMRAHGAHIVQVGSTGTCLDDAIAAAQAYVDDHPNAVFIPPFDHPDVFDGNGTIIDEILAQLGVGGVGSKLGIVCSVGGGGLFAGMVERLHENGLTNVPIVAVETEGAASLNHAIQVCDGGLCCFFLHHIGSICSSRHIHMVACAPTGTAACDSGRDNQCGHHPWCQACGMESTACSTT